MDWAVSVGPGQSIRVIAHVDDDRALEEAPHTAKVAGKVLVNVGVHAQLAKVSVIKEERWEQEAYAPVLPELVAAADIAKRLNITRQRVNQLAHDHPEFPEPVLRTGGGSLWAQAAIDRFATTWDRRPGRRAGISTQVVDLTSRVRQPRPVDVTAGEHSDDWRQRM
jgi:hypothetical protein